MNYKIAIVDDNITDIEYVTLLVRHWAEEAGHNVSISSFSSAEAFLFQYEEERDFDMLLLDIEMGKMNGVELAKAVRKSNAFVQLVFITGFPDFMAEGYEVSALHYLMKPVISKKLYAVLDKASTNLVKLEKRICVTYDRRTDFIPISHILYVEAQKQYVLIHTEKKIYRMKGSLVEMEKELDEFFYKCQRSFLINLQYVVRIQKEYVVLKNGEEIPISRGMAEKIGKEIIKLF